MQKIIHTIKQFIKFHKNYTEMHGELYYKIREGRYIKISL